MTEALYQQDAYLRENQTIVSKITENGGIVLQKTVFYPSGGGQPGDTGVLLHAGKPLTVLSTIKDSESGEIIHLLEPDQPLPEIGDEVTASIDWHRRYSHMRMHTALHLLCAVIPCGVTGGQIGESKSRLDFDIGDATLDKDAINAAINQLILDDHAVTSQWISDEELQQNPSLVRTMSVQPPTGAGRVRLLKIGDKIDLQPCGGTHVRQTSEIGAVSVAKIENKGKRNRRVNLVFA